MEERNMDLPYFSLVVKPLEHVKKSVEAFFQHYYTWYKLKSQKGIEAAKEIVYKFCLISIFITATLWVSVFLYVVFYYTYMPNVTHMRPVHLQFKPCEEQMAMCSFPSAHVQLTKRNQMLMSTQPYRIRLILDMPESQVNKDLGMFMVCAQMRAKGGVLVSSSCRSVMLRHRSWLHQLLRTMFIAPLLVSGLQEERQTLQIELFSDFEDDQKMPVTDAYVELQSRFVQVYTSELHIEAHFTGLRYLMYHWPRLCAAVGIGTNVFFVSLIFILSWYHLQEGIPTFAKTKPKNPKKKKEPDSDDHGDDKKQLVGKMSLEYYPPDGFLDESLEEMSSGNFLCEE